MSCRLFFFMFLFFCFSSIRRHTRLSGDWSSDVCSSDLDAGYQSNFRYGSQQSCTRDWSMPMHQLDTLFHKQKTSMSFIFGGEADNHAVNTVPKETLVKITKAEEIGRASCRE